MQTVTKQGTTYHLRDGIEPDAPYMDPSKVQGIEAPSALSDDRVSFPSDHQPGSRITFEDRKGGVRREGTIIDRAPQGVQMDPPTRWNVGGDPRDYERSGYWFWVQTDDGYYRVRYYSRGRRAGQAFRDDGPMIIRAITGPCYRVDDVDELKKRLGVVA